MNEICDLVGLTEEDVAGEPVTGLSGLFGHDVDADEEGRPRIKYQFRVLQRADESLYLVQMFSFLDGCPTNVEARSLEHLLGPTCRLYQTEDAWNWAYCKESAIREGRNPHELFDLHKRFAAIG